jgi:hypothetical protein
MTEPTNIRPTAITSSIQKLLDAPILNTMSSSLLEKLSEALNFLNLQQHFLKTISRRIRDETVVILRLKCWVMVHMLLTQKLSDDISMEVERLIEQHENKMKRATEGFHLSERDIYFTKEVELPYIAFLKKLAIWKMLNSLTLETDPVSIGFS